MAARFIEAQQIERGLADVQRQIADAEQHLRDLFVRAAVYEDLLKTVASEVATVLPVPNGDLYSGTFTSRAVRYVSEHPRCSQNEIVAAVGRPDKRRSNLTQIANLVRAGRFVRDDRGRLRIATDEEEGATHAQKS